MTDKLAVLGVLQRVPENASLEEIVQELRIVAEARQKSNTCSRICSEQAMDYLKMSPFNSDVGKTNPLNKAACKQSPK